MMKNFLNTAIVISILILTMHAKPQSCPRGEVYDQAKQLCKSCASIEYTIHAQISSLPGNNCKCMQDYQWSQQNLQCIKKNSSKRKFNQKSKQLQDHKDNLGNKQTNILYQSSSLFQNPNQQNKEINQIELTDSTQEILMQSSRNLQTVSCDSGKGFINYNGVCINCRSLMFTTGGLDGSSCRCEGQTANNGGVCMVLWNSRAYINNRRSLPCSSITDNPTLQSQCLAPRCNGPTTSPFPCLAYGVMLCSTIPNGVDSPRQNDSDKCKCKIGHIYILNLNRCVCEFGISFYDGNKCILCSSLPPNQQSPCTLCQSPYFYNGAYCLKGSLMPLVNITSASCPTGSQYQVYYQPYYFFTQWSSAVEIIATCACIFGSYYQDDNSCVECSAGAPGGVSACTSCLASSGYFKPYKGCVYCPSLPNSSGSADPYGNGCVCNANYFWSIDTSTCACDFLNNYVQIPGTNNCAYCPYYRQTTPSSPSMLPSNTFGCVCLNGVWNRLTLRCEGGICDNTIGIIGSDGVCITCKSLSFYTTGSKNGAGCACISSYAWNPNTFKCQTCNTATSIFIGSLCVNCADITNTNGPDPSGNSCRCVSPLQWLQNPSTQTGSCICDSASSITLPNSSCLSCADLAYGTGTASSNICSCLSNFVWDPILSTCYCPTDYTLNSAGKTCTCNTATSVVIGSLCVKCADITNTNGPDPSGNSCRCVSPLQWLWNPSTQAGSCICDSASSMILSNGTCLSCANIAYGTGTASSNICSCLSNFVWDPISFSCYCPISYALNTNSKTCICNTATNIVIGNVCISCSNIANSIGPNVGNSACRCSPPLQWSWNSLTQTGSCICSSPQDNCVNCLNGFLWSNTDFNWYCPIGFTVSPDKTSCGCNTLSSILVNSLCVNCSTIAQSFGPNTNNTECQCNSPFKWNWDTSTLIGSCPCDNNIAIIKPDNSCQSCTSIPYTTGNAINNTCICLSTFLWNDTSLSCQCQSGFSVSADNTSCICNTLSSILVNNLCINCSAMAHSLGPNANNTACQCNSPLRWHWDASTLTGSCSCNNNFSIIKPDNSCQSCTSIPYTTGNAVDNACTCLNTFLWNDTSLSCYCQSGFSVSADNTSCICNTMTSILKGSLCVNCSNIPNTVGPNADNTACQCAPTLLWVWNTSTLTGSCISCDTTYTILNSNNTCINCNDIAFATGTTLNNTCVCISNLVWNSDSPSCSCLSPLIYFPSSSSCACPIGFYKAGNNCNCNLNIGFILPNGSCFTCANVTGSTGIRQNSYTNICFCQVSFYWVWDPIDETGKCLCPNTTIYSPVSKSCVSIYPFGGIAKDSKNILCRNIPNSDGTVINSLTCGCFAPYVWSATDQTCICSTYLSKYYYIQRGTCTPCQYSSLNSSNQCSSCAQRTSPLVFGYDSHFGCYNCSTAPLGSPKCGCSSALGYYQNSTACIECSAGFSTGSSLSQCTSCAQANGFLKIGDLCIYCPFVAGATGVVDIYGCTCNTGLFWDSHSNTCACDYFHGFIAIAGVKGSCFDCSTVEHNQIPALPTACDCVNGYIWSPETNTCIVYVPPNELVFVGLSSPKARSPQCNQKTSIMANGVCTLCSSYSYATGNTVNSAGEKCQCADGLSWNADSLECGCGQNQALIESQTLPSTFLCVLCDFSVLSTGKDSSNSCGCPSPLVWSPQLKSCDCGENAVGVVHGSVIKCVSCDSSIYASFKKNSISCACLNNLIWTGSECQCNSQSILTPDLLCQNCGIYGSFNEYQCNCPEHYAWSSHFLSCVKCGSIAPNTIAASYSNKLTCVCSENTYQWDIVKGGCYPKCTENDASCLDCSLIDYANQQAVPTSSLTKATSLLDSEGINELYGFGNTNYNEIKGFGCSCHSGYTWDITLFKCFKNPSN